MLDALFGRSRLKRRLAAEELMNRLGEKASLVVDDRLIAELGVGRRALYHIVYDMVRRERMFMLADRDDRMLLMTNTEFNRFMFRRSGAERPLPALALGEAPSAADMYVEAEREEELNVVAEIADIDEPDTGGRMLTDDLFCDAADSGLLLGAPAGGHWEIPAAALDSALAAGLFPPVRELPGGAPERRSAAGAQAAGVLDWFRLDTAPEGAEGPELPDCRQSLPERRREPWPVTEEAG